MQNRDETHETTGNGGAGLTIRVRIHLNPFQYWVRVPPTAIQNLVDEHETNPRATGATVQRAAHDATEAQERVFCSTSVHDLPFQRATSGWAGGVVLT